MFEIYISSCAVEQEELNSGFEVNFNYLAHDICIFNAFFCEDVLFLYLLTTFYCNELNVNWSSNC